MRKHKARMVKLTEYGNFNMCIMPEKSTKKTASKKLGSKNSREGDNLGSMWSSSQAGFSTSLPALNTVKC